MSQWMLYGANGYTAGLILKKALERGQRPVLAGRNRAAIEALASKYSLVTRVFDLENIDTVASALADIDAVLHCAGPFSTTSQPMLEACLKAGTHYLDITGEIDVFAYCHQQDQRARDRSIVVIPGVGFDIVPTDCMAAMLKRDMPSANQLVLAFEMIHWVSHGSAVTAIESLAKGGRIRRNGQIKRVPLAYKSRFFDIEGERCNSMTIPWGDVYTAFVSTGIPNIEVYMTTQLAVIKRLRKLNWIRPFLGLKSVQEYMKSKIPSGGPSDDRRRNLRSRVRGDVRNIYGQRLTKQLRTMNGYDLTPLTSLGILEHILTQHPIGGFYTPSQLLGADYILSFPGSVMVS